MDIEVQYIERAINSIASKNIKMKCSQIQFFFGQLELDFRILLTFWSTVEYLSDKLNPTNIIFTMMSNVSMKSHKLLMH